jgi:hypothetical protein
MSKSAKGVSDTGVAAPLVMQNMTDVPYQRLVAEVACQWRSFIARVSASPGISLSIPTIMQARFLGFSLENWQLSAQYVSHTWISMP